MITKPTSAHPSTELWDWVPLSEHVQPGGKEDLGVTVATVGPIIWHALAALGEPLGRPGDGHLSVTHETSKEHGTRKVVLDQWQSREAGLAMDSTLGSAGCCSALPLTSLNSWIKLEWGERWKLLCLTSCFATIFNSRGNDENESQDTSYP